MAERKPLVQTAGELAELPANDTVIRLGLIPTLKLWLKADSLNLSDGTAVSTWSDSSGNGNDATQATGANQPIFKTNIINSLPIIRFNGTSQYFSHSLTLSANCTIFFVAKQTGSPTGYRVIFVAIPPSQIYHPIITSRSSTVNAWGTNDGASDEQTAVAIDTAFRIGTYRLALSTAELRTDGAVNVSHLFASFYAGDATNRRFIGATSGPTFYFSGDIAEIIAYNSALSTNDRQLVESYLGTKYGIVLP